MTTNPPLIYTPLSLNLPIVPLRLRPSSRGARRPEGVLSIAPPLDPSHPRGGGKTAFRRLACRCSRLSTLAYGQRIGHHSTVGSISEVRHCGFDHTGRHPLAIVEYKAPPCASPPAVFAQAAVYNTLLCPGHYHKQRPHPLLRRNHRPGQPPRFLNAIPRYSDLTSLNNPPSDENRPSSSNSL